ncbi:MAG: molybdopterin molybdotransferase MoeA [Hyphomicrobiales bacterium]
MADHSHANDCCFRVEERLMRHDEALALLRERIAAVAVIEEVAIGACHGRILAEPIIAPRDVPWTDNSAVDGFAFAHADYLAAAGRLPVAMRVPAGATGVGALAAGTAARIFTGAPMPAGADTVAMQEDCHLDGDAVVVPSGLKAGANRRKAGEDLRAGAVMIEAGARLRPQELAAIASTGRAVLKCFAPLKVAVVSTGDEIVRPGAPIVPGQVYDANFFLISTLLETLGAAVTDVGVLPDRADVVRETLARLATSHDVIVTSGGASIGEEDHLVAALEALGERHLWRLAIKPGRPMTFGNIGEAIFLGLPGNPVAAMVTFLNYARPVLTALAGAAWAEPNHYLLPADFEIGDKKPGRREFLRGILGRDEAGRPVVRKYPRDGSGIITSLREADGLIVVPEEATGVARGEPVIFVPFPEYGIPPR